MLFTEKQAADAAGVSRKTIRRLIKSGRLQAIEFGFGKKHNYRITPEALSAVSPKEEEAKSVRQRKRTHYPSADEIW